MPSNPRLLERVLDAYREGDLDECIRLVRTLVEGAPQATAPRQLLASLFASTYNGRQALAHYRRLLPLAVERGEVIRSIAFQKQIDVYESPESLVPGRWAELQKRLRQRGLPFLGEAPGGGGRPWVEAQLLALPRAWFERIAAETRFEIMGIEPRALDVEAGTVWEVLAGRMRWSFGLPDGRASAESLAAEGDVVHVDPGLAQNARVSFVPDLPVEALRFDAALARDLKLALAAGLQATPSAAEGLTPESRALLYSRPRRLEDLDDRPRMPDALEGDEPLRLLPRSDDALEPVPPVLDSGDWVEFGVLSLIGQSSANSADGDAAPPPADVLGAPPADRVFALPMVINDAGAPPAETTLEPPILAEALGLPPADATHDAPALAEQTSVTPSAVPEDAPMAEGEVVAYEPPPPFVQEWERASEVSAAGPEPADAGLAPVGEEEPPAERRRRPRVAVTFESRVALLRLSGSRVTPITGQLSDLSTSGFSIRFANQDLGSSRGALADAVVAVDMDLPGPRGALRVAAQVRWLDVDEPGDVVRLGIEFVLLTEPDRRLIAGTLARAALAARDTMRKAA